MFWNHTTSASLNWFMSAILSRRRTANAIALEIIRVVVLMSVWLFVSTLSAEEIEGKINKVSQSEISIDIVSEFDPVVGDKLEVLMDIPDVGLGRIATGRVTSVGSGKVKAQIEKATVEVAAGHHVRITSPKASRKPTLVSPTTASTAILGLALSPVDQQTADLFELPKVAGLIVKGVAEGAPAAVAGVKKRDVILTADDAALSNVEQFRKLISGKNGGECSLVIWRDGARLAVVLKLPPHIPPPTVAADITSTTQVGSGEVIQPLIATEIDRRTMARVVSMLEAMHISGHPLDSEIARRTLQKYLEVLDVDKVYFTQADATQFQARFDEFGEQMRKGELQFACDVFGMFKRRMHERLALADELISLSHDFRVDEQRVTAPPPLEFIQDKEQAREIWRKRVKHELLKHKSVGVDDEEARRRVRRLYRTSLQQVDRVSSSNVLDMAANSLALAYDPHSVFMAPKQQATFTLNLRGQLVGIGAQLQDRDGYVTVVRVIPKGPAARDGRLKPGDRIVAVGNSETDAMVDLFGMEFTAAIDLIRGESGSRVRLRVLSAGDFESSIYTFARGSVDLSKFAAVVLDESNLPDGRRGKVGFIHIPTFYGAFKSADQPGNAAVTHSSTGDAQQVLESFQTQGVELVVLDLRDNVGGSLSEAISFSGLFVGQQSTVVQVKDRDEKVLGHRAERVQAAWTGPLVVLTNANTAGGAEIVAGAIQDYRRGLVVGDAKTFGLGTVANLQDITQSANGSDKPQPLGQLKVVRERFYRPNGDGYQLRGVVPDVVLPSPNDLLKLGEETLDYALKFDQVATVKLTAANFPIDDKLREQLTSQSVVRRASAEYFQRLAGRASQFDPSGIRMVSLQVDKFMSQQRLDAFIEQAPSLQGIDDVKMTGYLSEALAVALDFLGRDIFGRAEKLYAERKSDKAIEAYSRSLATSPRWSYAHFKLAWVLSTCSDAGFRDGKLAVQSAQRACELGSSWTYTLVLALAEAEAGDFTAAQKHLAIALKEAPADQREAYRYLEQRFQSGKSF